MVLRAIISFLTAVAMASCLRYAPIKMQRQEYSGKGFRTDGYYYNRDKIYYDGRLIDISITSLIFHRNGFICSKSFPDTSLSAIEEELEKIRVSRGFLEGSGYYKVFGDSISIEFWTNASHFPVPTATVPARILNDTTLKSKILGHHTNDIWHFRPLSAKPDSTTIFDEQLERGLPIKRGKKQKLLGII